MELFNDLPEERAQDVEDFLAFIPIYDSKRRTNSLAKLLRAHKAEIAGKVCVEAGAGRGIFARLMAELGASKVYAVERSGALFQILEAESKGHSQVKPLEKDIVDFKPKEPVSVLFHELYGPLVLDETMLMLRELRFTPQLVLPDGGKLWAMPVSSKQLTAKDPNFDPAWAEVLKGALISELVTGLPFKPTWEVFSWDVSKAETSFEFEVPEACDFLAFCGEITHAGKSVLKMWWTNNWPLIFTPVAGNRFRIAFAVEDGYTQVHFEWC